MEFDGTKIFCVSIELLKFMNFLWTYGEDSNPSKPLNIPAGRRYLVVTPLSLRFILRKTSKHDLEIRNTFSITMMNHDQLSVQTLNRHQNTETTCGNARIMWSRFC
jgi:hypothetical protein